MIFMVHKVWLTDSLDNENIPRKGTLYWGLFLLFCVSMVHRNMGKGSHGYLPRLSVIARYALVSL